MTKIRIEDFINWKFALFVFMACISIWVGTSMSTEKSFLNADGGRNTANQKLMIVDQSTGEISFVKKSLSGINQNFTKEDNEIKEALKLILGNNLKGDTSGFIKTLKDDTNSLKNDVVKKTYVDTELAKKQVKGNYQAAGNYIANGNFVALARNGDNGCDGKGCRAVTGFKQKGRSHGDEDTGWKEADAIFNHGKNSTMRIWKN